MQRTGRAAPSPDDDREAATALAGLIALFVITSAWWALALWPVHNAPAWLERTRYVCFGVAETGLPDGGGWIGLIGGPLGMLAILLAGWGRGVRSLFVRARRSAPVAVTLAALVIGLTLLLGGAAARVQQAGSDGVDRAAPDAVPPLTYPRLNRPAPQLTLSAHDGSSRSLEQRRGRPVLVTFAYAHCQTVCPLVVRHALAAQRQLQDMPAPPVVLIVTLDPWRDTPSRLADMAHGWQLPPQDAWVLGGSVADVETTLDAWQVPRSRNLQTGEVTHPSLVYIIDAHGRIAFAAAGGVDALVSLVRRL